MATTEQYLAAVAKIERLNSAPAVLAKASQMLADPNTRLEELAALIQTDTSLTADIIRLSNSSLYNFSIPHNNLESAIARVGFKELLRLVGLSVSKSLMAKPLGSYGISAYEYWSESVSAAVLMEEVAKCLKVNSHDAYTAGILHVVGRLVINQLLVDFRIGAVWNRDMPLEEWEMEAVGFNYTMAGALLLERWCFPKPLPAVVQKQLEFETEASPSLMLRMLDFTIRLLKQTELGFVRNDWELPPDDRFLIFAKLSVEDIRPVVAIAKNTFANVKNSIGIKE